ncbi:lipopolysaccharide biosynthesis protein [Paracandidimonas lactea]|uniref:lipopolysaccharide biosynthesis protein n=1 Tax=Paracandidimonas lactea TaxID=2895524 RepID=UPI001F264679|nr:oligosaccharide flippase family protein [Paracandidimonas lactea]
MTQRPMPWSLLRLPNNPFARGVALLVGGTAGSQLLLIIAAPLLTRLYTPDEFGLLAIYTAMLIMLLSVCTLCYDEAIPLPAAEEDGANIAVLSMLVAVGMTALSAVVIHAWGDRLAWIMDGEALTPYMWVLPLGLLLGSLSQVLGFWALRRKSYGLVARTRFKQTGATLAMQLGGVSLGPLALLLGHALGQGAGCIALGRSAAASGVFQHVSWTGMRLAAMRYRNFPMFSTWSNLMDAAGRELPTILLAYLFGAGAAGLYALANRVLGLPMTVLGSAIAQVLLVNASQAHRDARLGALVRTVYEKLAQIAMPIVMVLVFTAPDLFAFVFGKAWREAGVLVQWMAPWLYVRFIASPLSTLIPVLEVQREGLVFYMIVFAVRVTAILAGGLLGDLVLTVALFSIGSMLCWVGYLIWITLRVGNSPSALLRPSLSALIWGALCMTPLITAKTFFTEPYDLWLPALAVSLLFVAARFLYLLRRAY